MYSILVGGYHPSYDKEKLKAFLVASHHITPGVRMVAFDLIDGLSIDDMVQKYGRCRGYTQTMRHRARLIMALILEANPEWFGLEKINPVREPMTTRELAAHSGVSRQAFLSLVSRKDKLGLPAPDRVGRGWVFPPDVANEYIKNLGR